MKETKEWQLSQKKISKLMISWTVLIVCITSKTRTKCGVLRRLFLRL